MMIAIGIIVGLIGGAVILTNPFLGLLITIVFVPLALVPAVGGGILGIFTAATPIKLIGGITFIGAFLKHIINRKRWDFFKEPTIKAYTLFLIYILINGFAMPSSFTRENFTFYVSIGIFALIILILVDNPKRLHQTFWVFMCAVFLTSLQSILTQGGGIHRSSGTSFDPNYYAISLLPFIAISFYNSANEKKPVLKFLSLIFSVTYLGAFAGTQSRGGFVGLCLMLLMAFLTARKKFLAFVIILISTVVIVNVMPAHFWERFKYSKTTMETGDEMNEALGSAMRRDLLAKAAWDMFLDNPVFGVGLGNYYWDCSSYYPVYPGRAHNMHLEILAEMGAVGYLIFVVIMVSYFRCLWRMIKKAPAPYPLLAKSFFIGHMGFLASAWFLHAQQEKGFWLIMFLAVAMERIWRNQDKEKAQQAQPVTVKVETTEEEPKPKKLKYWRM